jgi:tetratricopeptide (TPR) repeat protein
VFLVATPLLAADDPLRVERGAVAALLRGQPAAALKQLGGVKSSGTTAPELENLRGLAVMMSGDVKGSLPFFERALPLPEARFNRAVAMLKLAKYVEASAELEKIYADANSPLRATAAYHDALALDALRKPNDAITWLARALDLDPGFDSAVLYLGIIRERSGDLQGAGKAYKQFLDRHPDSIVAMLRFGIAAQRAGRPEVARKYFEKIVAAVPSSAEAAEARMYLEMWE